MTTVHADINAASIQNPQRLVYSKAVDVGDMPRAQARGIATTFST